MFSAYLSVCRAASSCLASDRGAVPRRDGKQTGPRVGRGRGGSAAGRNTTHRRVGRWPSAMHLVRLGVALLTAWWPAGSSKRALPRPMKPTRGNSPALPTPNRGGVTGGAAAVGDR